MSLLLDHALHSTFRKVTTETVGVDVSRQALKLARANLKHVGMTGSTGTSSIRFKHADILSKDSANAASIENVLSGETAFDIMVANPPYISPSAFYADTARSVRNFEPRLALVPNHKRSSLPLPAQAPAQTTTPRPSTEQHANPTPPPNPGDTFYPHIASLADTHAAKLVLMEVGDMAQAKRVAAIFAARTITTATGKVRPAWHAIEIWCDGILADGAQTRRIHRSGLFHVPIVGPKEITHGRTVVCWRNEAMYWLHTDSYIDGHWQQDEKAAVPWAFPVGSDFRTFSSGSESKPAEWFNHVRGAREVEGSNVRESKQEEVQDSPHYLQQGLNHTKR